MRRPLSHADDLCSVPQLAFEREIQRFNLLQYLHFFIFLLFPPQFLEGKLELSARVGSQSLELPRDPASSYAASPEVFHAFRIEKVVC